MFKDTLVKEVQESTERSIRFSGPAFPSQRRTRSPSSSTRFFEGKLRYHRLLGAPFGADPLEDEEAAPEEEGVLEERDSPYPVKNDSFHIPLLPQAPPPPPPFLDLLPVGSRLGACLSTWREI